MANKFLEKTKDLSKILLEITLPGLGVYTIKEAREIDNSPTEDSHSLTDPDIYGNVSTIQNKVTKREIKVTTAKGSDDDIFLTKMNKNQSGKLGTLVYIDDTGDNKISGIGEGVSVQKGGERKNNTKDIDIEYTILCAKYTEEV